MVVLATIVAKLRTSLWFGTAWKGMHFETTSFMFTHGCVEEEHLASGATRGHWGV